ncbi:DEAD/DEAH box helicase family protein [Microbacterium sp. NPDC064584]|uniref:DEAD/DEAH box helicase n=1 Tax=Microbacterium sp. NPDC064584 TaxID=3155817 RepID=UPI00341BF986
MTVSWIDDPQLVEEIAARFDLRDPNRRALAAVVEALATGAGTVYPEVVVDLATGVGKTFLMSSLVDYAAAIGVRHVLVVTPGSVIQAKTLANFDAASEKYVAGADMPPFVITPENFRSAAVASALRDDEALKVFVFNVHQLISPRQRVSRKVREMDENLGAALYEYLKDADDLLVVADEHHIYHQNAASFSAAIRDLDPLALVGLTATPAESDRSKVIFQYTLGEAIADELVKVPVIVYRKDGTRDEETQLKDACTLLRRKEVAYLTYREANPTGAPVKPVLFVVAASIEHAGDVAQTLASPGFIGDPSAVLEVTSESSDEALAALAAVESADSPIKAIVSVNKLREGWDVRNIAVIVALRRLASQSLTEQILGRGLRLPFGSRTQVPLIDQVDLVAHDSYQQLLAQKDILRERIESPPTETEVDEQGAATSAGDLPTLDPTLATDDPRQPGPSMSAVVPSKNVDLSPVVRGTPGQAQDEPEVLFFLDADQRKAEPEPVVQGRTEGAPQIVFPRREARLTYSAFTLSDIPNGDAQAAGARFITEVPTFLAKDALEASRDGDDIRITVTPQQNVEAQQTLTGIDTVREDLTAAILSLVVETREERNGARRLTGAFLRGAGVTEATETSHWGENRRHQAVQGITNLIQAAYGRRKREMTYDLVAVSLPVEPVLVDGAARNAYNDEFLKHAQFTGWQRNIMPVASFDAGSTEWKLAQLLDRDPEIEWWLRIYTNGPAFIPTAEGSYFPDFIAIDVSGVFWVIEGKADKNSHDADVLRKREAAERWARAVRDDGTFGDWHYVFANETAIRQAGSWAALKVATNPE